MPFIEKPRSCSTHCYNICVCCFHMFLMDLKTPNDSHNDSSLIKNYYHTTPSSDSGFFFNLVRLQTPCFVILGKWDRLSLHTIPFACPLNKLKRDRSFFSTRCHWRDKQLSTWHLDIDINCSAVPLKGLFSVNTFFSVEI